MITIANAFVMKRIRSIEMVGVLMRIFSIGVIGMLRAGQFIQ